MLNDLNLKYFIIFESALRMESIYLLKQRSVMLDLLMET